MYLQNIEWQGYSLPVQWVQALPYLLTLFILVTAVGTPRPPSALGKSDSKSHMG